MSKVRKHIGTLKQTLACMDISIHHADRGSEVEDGYFLEKLEKIVKLMGYTMTEKKTTNAQDVIQRRRDNQNSRNVRRMAKLTPVVGVTPYEAMYIKAMSKSCFNDNGDNYKTTGVWAFSVTDEIREFSIQQAKGVLASLVKKGFVQTMDNEGHGNPDDTVVWLTEAGIEVEGSLK